MKRSLIVIAALALMLTAAAGFSAFSFAAQNVSAEAVKSAVSAPSPEPRDIVINLGRDVDSYNVTWENYSGDRQYLEWAKKTSDTQTELPAKRSSAAALKSADLYGGYCFRAKMTGLESGCEYLYRVGGENGWSPTYTVSTGTSGDGRFTFLFAGDPQIGASGTTVEDGARWNTTLEKAREWFGDRVEFLMCAGDQIDDHSLPVEYDHYTAPELLRSLPQINNVGNHDNGSTYSCHYTFDGVDADSTADAGAMGADYWVAYDGALIMSLNTNNMSTAVHKAFMQRAIAEYTDRYGAPNWKIVTFHHAMFSAAVRRMDVTYYREALSPVMSELGIDAVLTGHDHVYTRSYLIDSLVPDVDPDHYVKVGGDPYGSVVDPADGEVFYLTANSSTGSKMYTLFTGEVPYAACKNQESVPNITKVDVAPDAVTFTTYRTLLNNSIGDVVDFFAIRRTGAQTDTCAPFLDVPSEVEFDPAAGADALDGVFAYDNVDGDLTARVNVSGTISKYAASEVTYTVADSSGNRTEARCVFRPVTTSRCMNGGEEWTYLDNGSFPFEDMSQVRDWLGAGFDDSEWKTGRGPFGVRGEEAGVHAGRVPETQINLYVPDGEISEGDVIGNYFFRSTFDVADPENAKIIRGLVEYDDGYDLYINGVKVATKNTMSSDGWMGYSGSLSPTDATPDAFVVDDPAIIASLGLKKQGNVIAVELFQCSENSDDVYFGLSYLETAAAVEDLPFEDVWPGAWYYDMVAGAYSRGLFYGVSPTLFEPDSCLSRAMAWTVIARVAGAELENGDKWYDGARNWAIENGVSDGTYPTSRISREQLCVMLYGLAGKPRAEGDLSAFNDAHTASEWARDALTWALGSGLVAGRGDATLAPALYVTRSEACTIILRYLELTAK